MPESTAPLTGNAMSSPDMPAPTSEHHVVIRHGLPHPSMLVVRPAFSALVPWLMSLPERLAAGQGTSIHRGRNELRVMAFEGREYVVKAFRRAHIVNRYVYGLIRPTKAKRSFDNALRLLAIGVPTPAPVGYYNIRSRCGLSLVRSYYVSVRSTCRYRYEDLFTGDIPYADDVLRAIGRLTARLHEHHLAHKDYGRANILFDRDADGRIRLELVDLNRMHVGPLDIKAGCRNFERLPATPHMHRLMAETYAAARGFDADECFRLMQAYRATQGGKIDGKY